MLEYEKEIIAGLETMLINLEQVAKDMQNIIALTKCDIHRLKEMIKAEEVKDPKELSPEEQEAFEELAKRCFKVISGKKPEEAPVETADLSTEKEEPKEIVGKEEKQAHKYRYSAYRIKGDK